jgi:radical SAM superfamily enzyme YgiQ (UPF0313 family)
MPQAIAVWCEEAGHDVSFVCYTGLEDLNDALPPEIDLLFVGAFTQAAQLSYSVSNMFRQRGVVTVLGGPHARCYPDDACKYFDYVLGFTDKKVIEEVLDDCRPHRPFGRYIAEEQQPSHLPGVRERWKYIETTLAKAPTLKIVPMVASLGCPYTCSFCIDSEVDYKPLATDQVTEDLRFLAEKMPKAYVGWHDPNFGIRFDDYMGAVEAGSAGGKTSFIAESSLALLSEKNLKRMRDANFKALLPGIESCRKGIRPLEHDAALRAVRAGQFRTGPRFGSRRRTFRAHEALPG